VSDPPALPVQAAAPQWRSRASSTHLIPVSAHIGARAHTLMPTHTHTHTCRRLCISGPVGSGALALVLLTDPGVQGGAVRQFKLLGKGASSGAGGAGV